MHTMMHIIDAYHDARYQAAAIDENERRLWPNRHLQFAPCVETSCFFPQGFCVLGPLRIIVKEAAITERRFPPPLADHDHSPSTRRRCSSRISSALLVRDRRTSSANGASGRHERHESEGMRLVTAASGWRSSLRKSIALIVRHAGQCTHKNQ
jgi:hypothetical protein